MINNYFAKKTNFIKKATEFVLLASIGLYLVGCSHKDKYAEINTNLAKGAVPAGEISLNIPAGKNMNNPFHMEYRLNSEGKYESFIDYTVLKVKNIPIKVQSKDSLGNYRYQKLAKNALRPVEEIINDKFPVSSNDIEYEYGRDSLIYSVTDFNLGAARLKVYVEHKNEKPFIYSDTTVVKNKF
ncbi:MAG: hypothetical protein WC755_00025 [Candidatus Woesearchaeota archaeon]|jgi:hypothetical protein